MNFSAYKCLYLLRYSSSTKYLSVAKTYLLHSINNTQSILITRTVLTRPKELDELRKKRKVNEEKTFEYKQVSKFTEEIGGYGYFLLTIPIIAFGLGTWQIYRREWKLNLIDDLKDRFSREPVELPENLDDLVELDYCPIKAKGEFLHDKEFAVGPRSLIIDGHGATEGKGNLISGSHLNRGYNIITPFKLEDRDLVILVNRGWLPNKYKHAEERKNCRMEGTLEITGINRLTEKRPQFVTKNDPQKGIWHYRDVHEMAEFAGTEPVFLDMIESDPDAGMPIGAQTKVNVRNEHLSYIVTWYGLSAFTGWYWFRQFIQKRPIL